MTSPIPFLLLGKNPGHLQACIDAAKPDFEVVRKESSVDDAKTALSELLGDSPKISFITMGGGFTNTDLEELRALTKLPFFRPATTAPDYKGPMPTSAPPAEFVASRLRKGLDDHADDIKAGRGSGEIWYF